jgi:hypothetical protein
LGKKKQLQAVEEAIGASLGKRKPTSKVSRKTPTEKHEGRHA